MTIAADLDFSELAAALERLPDALGDNFADAMDLSVTVAVEHVRRVAGTSFTSRSGALMASIQPSAPPVSGRWIAGTLVGSFGYGATSDDGYPYGLAIDLGSRPHVIRARRRRFLRIPVEGGFMFARSVNHPGTRATHFSARGLEAAMPEIERVFADAIDDALDRVGLGRR